ncbi:molybdate ABC transporter substrate-binding protein [Rhodovulum sp. DZ06]|uniref:molybdate ABC transporter substrate-binding protein n=1 Tax=Rhodovulum sp. DZ06 TaxID=3425126 RepID=UPI003D343188
MKRPIQTGPARRAPSAPRHAGRAAPRRAGRRRAFPLRPSLHRLGAALLALTLLLPAALAPAPSLAAEALVAVAANFADTARFLAAEYGARSGHQVTIASGSTGKIYAQIKAGAPFHAFLSADAERPRLLVEEGLAVPDSRFTYALGRLVLWSADPERIGPDGAATLSAQDYPRLAIANPRLAPYGLAAQQVLEKLGLWDALQPKLARGENIGQAYAMTASGAAPLGFVAAAQAGAGPKGSAWAPPPEMYDEIRQDAVLLRSGAQNEAAKGFLAYLDLGYARGLIRDAGYGTPSSSR